MTIFAVGGERLSPQPAMPNPTLLAGSALAPLSVHAYESSLSSDAYAGLANNRPNEIAMSSPTLAPVGAASRAPSVAAGETMPGMANLRALLDPAKVMRAMSGAERASVTEALRAYNKEFAFKDTAYKQIVVDQLRRLAHNAEACEAELNRLHLPRYAQGNEVRYAVEYENPNGGLLEDHIPRAKGELPRTDWTVDEWRAIPRNEKIRIVESLYKAFNDIRYDNKYKLLERLPDSTLPDHLTEHAEKEGKAAQEIKTKKYYTSLDQVYQTMGQLFDRYHEGDPQIHISFGNAARTGNLARDITNLFYFLELITFVDYAATWNGQFSHPWVQMPTGYDLETIASRFKNDGHFGDRFKYSLVAPRDTCYEGKGLYEHATTKGVEVRGACQIFRDGDQALDEFSCYTRFAELIADTVVNGGLPQEFAEALDRLPKPPIPFSHDPERCLNDERIARIASHLAETAYLPCMVHGVESTYKISDTALYGPWFRWDTLPFVTPEAAASIKKSSAECIELLANAIDESEKSGGHSSNGAGAIFNAILMNFMASVQNDVRDAEIDFVAKLYEALKTAASLTATSAPLVTRQAA